MIIWHIKIQSVQPSLRNYMDIFMISKFTSLQLKVDVPIVGVPNTLNGWDVIWMTNTQAGWLKGSVSPTWEGSTVLTGRVTNASGIPGPFAEIKSLK